MDTTSANVQRYLAETSLAEEMLSPIKPQPEEFKQQSTVNFKFASTPQLDVRVNSDSSSEFESDPQENRNRYKEKLRYLPNSGFKGEHSVMAGASVPNTFKHKSHPNAKTKSQIGQSYTDVSSEFSESGAHHSSAKENFSHKSPFVESKAHDASNHGTTPTWMFSDLADKWQDDPAIATAGSSGDRQLLPDDIALNLPNSNFNTLVHKPLDSDSAPAQMPMWMKMSNQYNENKFSDSPLHRVFLPNVASKDSSGRDFPDAHKQAVDHDSYSTVSTPMANRNSDIHLTKQHFHKLEDMLKRAKNEPDDYPIPLNSSPLKLYGNGYDTFTKAELTKFLEKARSMVNSFQRESKPVSMEPPQPLLKTKNFERAKSDRNTYFMGVAEDLIANIKKTHKEFEALDNTSEVMNSHGQANFTSTPKPQRLDKMDDLHTYDAYSSFSSSAKSDVDQSPALAHERNEFTSFDKSDSDHNPPGSYMHSDSDSLYTFDETTNFISQQLAQSRDIEQAPHLDIDHASPEIEEVSNDESFSFENSMSSVKRNTPPVDNDLDSLSLSPNKSRQFSFHSDGPIRLRTASQLMRLENSNRDNIQPSMQNNIAKGIVRPGESIGTYGDMVFDQENNRWVPKASETEQANSLDAIQDLDTISEDQVLAKNADASILKKPSDSARKAERNLEVSFHLPNSHQNSLRTVQSFDVTNASNLGDTTFSQSKKLMVSLITTCASSTSWDDLTFIDMIERNIDNVEKLEDFLPKLRKINLSHNKLKYLDGLPSTLLDLNISHNKIQDLTSFEKFRDLQNLSAGANFLRHLSGLAQNINLTILDVSKNKISSLEGIKTMNNLSSLNLSNNRLAGELDFAKFDFPNLREVFLSSNKLKKVKGIEALPQMRVLDLNENSLVSVTCDGSHKQLRKLSCKSNKLQHLNVECFPNLKVLRVDGNKLESLKGLRTLTSLIEVSARCQDKPGPVSEIVKVMKDSSIVDLSGNTSVKDLFAAPQLSPFSNVNKLTLSAVGLSSVSEAFGEKFFNVRDLNLNFNKLKSLDGLARLHDLRRLTLVGNNLKNSNVILDSLRSSRKTLQILDLRLNALNHKIYPYVFSPEEYEPKAEETTVLTDNDGTYGAIPFQTHKDLEDFTIVYDGLVKEKQVWLNRDLEFCEQLQQSGDKERIAERIDYDGIFVVYFPNLSNFDGRQLSQNRRARMRARYEDRTRNKFRAGSR